METSGFELALIGFLAATLAYGGFALRLLRIGYYQATTQLSGRRFLAAIVASALWGAAGLGVGLAPDAIPPTVAAGADLLRYAAWFWFLLGAVLPSTESDGRSEVGLLRPVAIVLVVLGALAIALTDWSDAPFGERAALFASMAQPVFGLLLVEQLFRNLPRDSRWGAKPLCLGLAGLFMFDLYIYSEAVLFGAFDADAFSIRAGIHTLAVPLLFVAARRQGDWRTRLQVSHNAAFYSASLLLAGGYLLFISALGYYVRFFGGGWGRALQLAVLFSALIFLGVLVLSGSMRARLRVFIAKNFFAYRYDYREEWLRFTDMLSAPSSPQEMGSLALRGLADMVESPEASLWLRSAGDGEFVETTRTKQLVDATREPEDGALARFLGDKAWIVDVAEAERAPSRYEGLVLPAWLVGRADSVWAVVPLIVGESLTGFVLLAPPRTPTVLDWEVRDLLKTASRQAAAFLAQLHAAEALLEARKFDAFNRMSAFVVHDLKNIVTQLSLMMKHAERLQDNPEFQKDMRMTVESALEKMRQLMLQLREGEKPPGGAAGVDLRPIVQRVAAVATQRGRALELEQLDAVATRGHAERMERVLGHIVQTAFDATPPDGRVWLALRRHSGQAHVVVGDTGQGMTRDFVEQRLFKPFSSTKASGMGIGSYESLQYVRELGGRINVDSEPGRGTVITVVLPVFESRIGSDLEPMSEAR
jgi:putative PEP-CTERM system histidine kinase